MKFIRMMAYVALVTAKDFHDECLEGYERNIGYMCTQKIEYENGKHVQKPFMETTWQLMDEKPTRCKKACDEDRYCYQFFYDLDGKYCWLSNELNQLSEKCTELQEKKLKGKESFLFNYRKTGTPSRNLEQGCIFTSYKRITGRGVKMCPDTLGSKTGTVAECQELCNTAKDCYGFMHGDSEKAECKFVGSTDDIFEQNVAKSEFLYVKECQDLDQLQFMAKENVTKTMDLLDSFVRQLSVDKNQAQAFINPDLVIERNIPNGNIIEFDKIGGIPHVIMVFLWLAILSNFVAVLRDKYTNCQKIVFLIPFILCFVALIFVTSNFSIILNSESRILKIERKDSEDVWDCEFTNYPLNLYTCWADQSKDDCPDNQEVYDSVLLAGGSNKAAYDLLQKLIKNDCKV